MIRDRWLVCVIWIQIICALIVINRPSGSDWIVFVVLIGSALLSIEGLARLRGWNWDD